MSRIYVVETTLRAPAMVRFVRANTLNAAIRAVAAEQFTARAASADDIVAASQAGTLDILDVLAQADDGADPAPVPQDAGADVTPIRAARA